MARHSGCEGVRKWRTRRENPAGTTDLKGLPRYTETNSVKSSWQTPHDGHNPHDPVELRSLRRQAFIRLEAWGRLLDLLAPQPGERILDLGCGTGHLTAKIAEAGAEVVGIDSSSEMVAEARAFIPISASKSPMPGTSRSISRSTACSPTPCSTG